MFQLFLKVMTRRSRAFHNTIRLVIELRGKSQNNKRCFKLRRINYDNIRINYVNIMIRFSSFLIVHEKKT